MPPRKASSDDAKGRSAADFVPATPTLKKLKEAAKGCRGCDLFQDATQTVFGEGTTRATVMFVGEQPGDQEDLAGVPFVGPAGKLFNRALDDAGIERRQVYVTNAVKHFKFEWRGKRRLHAKPNRAEVTACRPWVIEEIHQVKPEVIVCLGATAAQSLIDKSFKVTQRRGEILESEHAPRIMATVHPSSILRSRDDESRRREYQLFVDDLKRVAELLARGE